jgi:hypothetical protein
MMGTDGPVGCLVGLLVEARRAVNTLLPSLCQAPPSCCQAAVGEQCLPGERSARASVCLRAPEDSWAPPPPFSLLVVPAPPCHGLALGQHLFGTTLQALLSGLFRKGGEPGSSLGTVWGWRQVGDTPRPFTPHCYIPCPRQVA